MIVKHRKLSTNCKQVIGVVGLRNLGNTCYMNSIIQLLSNIQPLSDYFTDVFQINEINRNNPLSSKGIITVAFSNLLKKIWKFSDEHQPTKFGNLSINPSEFLKLISYFNPQFGQGKQQDAQEFLLYLLDMIHEDLNRVIFPAPITPLREYCTQKENQQQLEILASVSWGDHLQRSKSIIVDLMQGQTKNSIQCQSCGFSLYKFEPTMYLSLPIDDFQAKIQLFDCIKSYISPEQLSSENQWKCQRCDKMVQCVKIIELWKLPTILMIHIKRFKFQDDSASKIATPVEFPLDILNLTDLIQKFQKESPIYELLGCVCHIGNISKGHYVTYARNKENFKWYLYNDQQVKEIKPETIPQDQVYLLIYGKSTIPLIKRQTLSMPDNWPHLFLA